jgi:hypothetical protein
VQTFTPNGVFEVYSHGSEQPSTSFVGQEQLRAYALDSFARRLSGARTRHFQTNTVFDGLRPDSARTVTMVLITHVGPPDQKLRVGFTGAYHDRWVKLDGAWKLQHRLLRTDSERPAHDGG